MAATLLGSKELNRKLKMLAEKSSKKAITAGIRAGMTPIAKAMRAAINSSDASPVVKREARKTIGARFGKTRRITERHAKVGFAVGKRAAAVQSAMKARGKRVAKTGGSRPKGQVGVSAQNIHWFVLGTKERHWKTKTGQSTGEIEDVFRNVTKQALATSAGASIAAARRKITQVIEREARKKG
jgi:hypothetical protein